MVKAINGVSGSGNYTYELYDTKEGNLIESKTEVKGTEVTFTNCREIGRASCRERV